MHTPTPRSEQGFTLLELMIVVTLIALMLMLAAPSITIWLQNLKVRNVGESIVSGLQLARMEAIRRNTRVTFSMVSSTDSSCTMSATSPSWVVSKGGVLPTSITNKCAGTMADAGGDIIQKNSASVALQGVTLSSSGAANCLTYDGLGQLPTQGSIACTTGITSIDITSPTADTIALRVTVSSGGQVRLCYPDTANQLPTNDPRKC
ncbi:GspH/FimT family pseudopilin [Aquabacterium sp. G14]|uniref:GspH/FimT family pseudopilin n=1 Tax=Aquabacterium sp. G14 TaxID=3130164 RepID=UPI0030B69C08